MVEAVAPHVEHLAGRGGGRGLERGDEGTRGVPTVHVGPPLAAAEDGDVVIDDRLGRQRVHHEVESHAW